MKQFFEEFTQETSDNFKWNTRTYFYKSENIIPMSVADMDLKTAPVIIEALNDRVNHGAFGYPLRLESYYDSFIQWMKKRHYWDIKREELVNIPMIVPAINVFLHEFTQENDDVVILTPVYKPFSDCIKTNNRTLVCCELFNNDGYYTIDFQSLEHIFQKGCKAMIFCSPHNPVGRVWTKEELQTLGELIKKYNVLMISDEIHLDIVFRGNTHTPSLTIPALAENTICFTSPGKSFNIAGLHSSIAVIKKQSIRDKFAHGFEKLGLLYGNIFGIKAFQTAYESGETWFDKLLLFLEENRDIVVQFIKENIPAIKVSPSEGTFLMWLDCRNLYIQDDKIFEFFAQKAHLGLTPGTDFGKGGSGFMRMNIAFSRPVLLRALQQLKEAYNETFC